MIISKLAGGMGNQMFQYAHGRAMSLYHETALKLDAGWLLDHTSRRDPGFVYRDFDLGIFNIQATLATPADVKQVLREVLPVKKADAFVKKVFRIPNTKIREQHFRYDPSVRNAGANVYLDGYWQSEKYFKDYADVIRNDFSFAHPLGDISVEMMNRIMGCNAVCVNVRRGDFLQNAYHGIVTGDYYSRAAEWMLGSVSNAVFFVFSDDIPWCMENLRFTCPTVFVTKDLAGEKYRDYLWMMTECRHFIIPNSSFGWWAAWLCRHDTKQVVAPATWFHEGPKDTDDLIPAGWVTM